MLACAADHNRGTPDTMARYKLHGFCQSGNTYKVALYLNCAGLDWEPVFVDYMNGATRDAKWREATNEMGEVPVLDVGSKKMTQSGAILLYLAEMTDKFAPETDDERNEALRWILFDNHKFTSYFATYRFMKSLAPQAPDPAVMAFLKGRFDGAAAIVDEHLGQVEVHDRGPADDRRLLAGRLHVLPRRGARLRLGQEPSQHPRLDRAPARPARLEGPLRAAAGPAHQAAEVRSAWRSRRRLTQRFNITHPVISAPMDVIAGGKLAAAVSGAGGLGMLGGGYSDDDDWFEREFAAGRQPGGRLRLHHLGAAQESEDSGCRARAQAEGDLPVLR